MLGTQGREGVVVWDEYMEGRRRAEDAIGVVVWDEGRSRVGDEIDDASCCMKAGARIGALEICCSGLGSGCAAADSDTCSDMVLDGRAVGGEQNMSSAIKTKS